jgi:hypothetical protein
LTRIAPRIGLRLVPQLPPELVPPPAPEPVPGSLLAAGAGLAAIAVLAVIEAYALWQLGEFQDKLREKGFVILEDPQALCVGGCHMPAPHSAPSLSQSPGLPPDVLKDWLRPPQTEQPGTGPAERPGQPAPGPEVSPPEAAKRGGRYQRPDWRTQIDPNTGAPYVSEQLYKQGRRSADQKCPNSQLDDLQTDMHDICDTLSGCGGSAKTKARIPCSVIRTSIAQIKECLKRRQDIQDECFTTVNPSHQIVMSQLGQALQNCIDLELLNCAPGHPMANL